MTRRCRSKDRTVPLLAALRLADLRLGRRKLLKSPVSLFLQSYPALGWLVMAWQSASWRRIYLVWKVP